MVILPVIIECPSIPALFTFLLFYLFTFRLKTAIALPPDKNILIVSTLRHGLTTALVADGFFIKLYTTAAKTEGIAGG